MRNEIRTVHIKRAGNRTDFHFDDGEWSTLCLHFDDGGSQMDSLHFDDEEGERLALIIGYTSIEGCIRARTYEHIDRGVPRGMETIAETALRAGD